MFRDVLLQRSPIEVFFPCVSCVLGAGWGLVQERRNSIANALDLRPSYTSPSICRCVTTEITDNIVQFRAPGPLMFTRAESFKIIQR